MFKDIELKKGGKELLYDYKKLRGKIVENMQLCRILQSQWNGQSVHYRLKLIIRDIGNNGKSQKLASC